MPRPIEALIHRDALAHNLARARAAAPDARVWAVVKANAYGHGIERAFAGLRGADGFALLDLAEAERIRALGWRGPVLLLEGCFEPRDLELCSRLNLWHVVHRDAQIDWLAAHKTQPPHRVFLKLNSGMNRLGFAPARSAAAWARLTALPQVDEITLMTHFSDADGERGIAAPARASSRRRRSDLPGERIAGQQRGDRCATAATAGVARRLGARRHHDLRQRARLPGHDIAHWDLQPTMTLRSQLIAMQAARSPATASATAAASPPTAPMRIGVVACGYADGYPRHAGPTRHAGAGRRRAHAAPSAASRWT